VRRRRFTVFFYIKDDSIISFLLFEALGIIKKYPGQRFGCAASLYLTGKGLLPSSGIGGVHAAAPDMHAAAGASCLRILTNCFTSARSPLSHGNAHAVGPHYTQVILIFARPVLAYVIIRFVDALDCWLAKRMEDGFPDPAHLVPN